MKKNKKMLKKMIAGLGGITAIATPVIAVSACSLEVKDENKVSTKASKAAEDAGYKVDGSNSITISGDKFNLENAKTFEHINEEKPGQEINSKYMFGEKEGITSKVIIITKGDRINPIVSGAKELNRELLVNEDARYEGVTQEDLDSAVALIFFQENVYQTFKVDTNGKTSETDQNIFKQGDLPKASTPAKEAAKEAGYNVEDDNSITIDGDNFNLENAKTFEHINEEKPGLKINSKYMFTEKERIRAKVIIITKGNRINPIANGAVALNTELPVNEDARFEGVTQEDLDSAVALIFFQENVYQTFKVDTNGKTSETDQNIFKQGNLPNYTPSV